MQPLFRHNIQYFLERSQYIHTMYHVFIQSSRLLFIVLTLVYKKFRICYFILFCVFCSSEEEKEWKEENGERKVRGCRYKSHSHADGDDLGTGKSLDKVIPIVREQIHGEGHLTSPLFSDPFIAHSIRKPAPDILVRYPPWRFLFPLVFLPFSELPRLERSK